MKLWLKGRMKWTYTIQVQDRPELSSDVSVQYDCEVL